MLRSKSICNKISVFFHSYFLFSKLWVICKRHKVNMNWYKKQRYKSPYMNKDIHVFQMKTANIESVANRQSRRCCAGIPMDEDRNINARMVQHRRRCANIQWTHLSQQMFSFRNLVRVVLLIARGWRGTSLPRVNVRKGIQRHRCWAFYEKEWVSRGHSWRITLRKRNTNGVETFFLYHDLHFLTLKHMADCA